MVPFLLCGEKMMKGYTHEVYIGRVDDQVVYVGEGRKDRHMHLNSGISNVYFANKHHFRGGKVEIEVVPLMSKEEGVIKEKELIQELNPLWNLQLSSEKAIRTKLKRQLSRWFNRRSGNTSNREHRIFMAVLFHWSGGDEVTIKAEDIINLNFIKNTSKSFGGLSSYYYKFKKGTPTEVQDYFFEDIKSSGKGEYTFKLKIDNLKDIDESFMVLRRSRGFYEELVNEQN
jgi:hypothetical protein